FRPDTAGLSALADVAKIERHLATDDRLDPLFGRLLGELEGTEEIAGIGDAEGRLAIGCGELEKHLDRQGALEKRERRMHPEMHETDFAGDLTHGTILLAPSL